MKRIIQVSLIALMLVFVSTIGWTGASAIRDDTAILNGKTYRDATTPDTVKMVGGLPINLLYQGTSFSKLAGTRADSVYYQWYVTDSTKLKVSIGLKAALAAAPTSFAAYDTISTTALGVGVKKVTTNMTGYDQLWLIFTPLSGNAQKTAGNKVYLKLQRFYTPGS